MPPAIPDLDKLRAAVTIDSLKEVSKNEKSSNGIYLNGKPTFHTEKEPVKVVKESPFTYVHKKQWGIVWTNVVIFAILHGLYAYSWYVLLTERRFKPWILGWFYGVFGGLGITAGAHRLWSHKSYKARLPLRIFLMLAQCVAGQNDLYTWCRDHRVHHRFSESDADPHNVLRGYFFAHMGWLLTKKHPDVIKKGKSVHLTDLLEDPVIRFQKRFYLPLYFLMAFIIPTAIPVYLWNETWLYSFLICTVSRYTTSLHSTWFVNSTAHLYGNRPYNLKINPRENSWVSFGALGEGYHNYHHTFPWDYATSEDGCKLNLSKVFIDYMAKVGLAYDLRRVSEDVLKNRKEKVAEMSSHHHQH